MAYLGTINCTHCGEVKHEILNGSTWCNQCSKEEADKDRRKTLASFKGLTVEERLEKIEAWIYDGKFDQRIARVENETRRIS